MPWDPRYRKQGVQGITANAIDVVIETGRLGPGHAGRHQSAERSDGPRAVRQQVGLAVERQRSLRAGAAAVLPQRVRVDARRGGARPQVGRVRRRADDQHARSHRPCVGQGRRAPPGQPAARPEGALLGAGGVARRPGRALLPARSQARRARAGRRRGSRRRRARRIRALRAQRAGPAPPRARGHADRGRPHAQPPDDRPLADGQHEGDREARARRQDLLRGRRRAGVSRRRRPAAGRGAADQVGGRLRGGAGTVRDLRHPLRSGAARRGRRPRQGAESAVLHRVRHAEARGREETPRARSRTSRSRIRWT